MRVITTWRRGDGDTIHGDSITITYTYTSFKKEEIDAIQEECERSVGTMRVSGDFDLLKKSE